MAGLHVGSITFDWYPFDATVRRLSEAMVDAGYTVDVICLRQANEKRYEVCNGVHTYRVPMDRGFGGSLPANILNWCWFTILTAIAVTKIHLKHRYDIIQVHNMPDFLVFATLIPKLLGAKVILEIQDTCPELMAAKAGRRTRAIVKALASIQERISTAYADHVITVGWPFEKLLLKRGVPTRKMTVILNSADPRVFPASYRTLPTTEADQERPFIFMYHGTLAYRTGLDIAIRALAEARTTEPNLRLDIKGRGEHVPALKALAAELGQSEHVQFSDPCPMEELVHFVVHGDVGLIPYRCDGFEELVLPTKAYEFAWMHRPMIASNTAGIRSMFRPESIVLCDPENPAEFAQAMLDLYHHPEKRAQMIANAAEDYVPYRWEAMSERYVQLMETLSRKTGKQGQKQSAVDTKQAVG